MSQRVTLDDSDMRARLRSPRHADVPAPLMHRVPARHSRRLVLEDPPSAPAKPIPTVQPTRLPDSIGKIRLPTEADSFPYANMVQAKRAPNPAAAHRPERSKVLMRHAPVPSALSIYEQQVESFMAPTIDDQAVYQQPDKHRFRKPSRAALLTAMAVSVFLVGIGVSLAGIRTNHIAAAQTVQVNKKLASGASTTTAGNEDTPPSTELITATTLAAYQVAPDLARYISIPKYGVKARVLQIGVTNKGALATPTNVFDSAWYSGSARPGQAGATLIDGHVSSWTTNGVFYNIKNLVAGDKITLQKGDGTVLIYSVNKTVVYPVDGVDMSALVTPTTAGKSGLNLITCGGKYDSKSGEFTQRIGVFATLDS